MELDNTFTEFRPGSRLPGMDVEFKDLTYSVPIGSVWSKKSEKVILKEVSGIFKPGQLSAIMGPSGAGKSSLLNALSGFRSTGVRGSLMTNGKPRDERVFRSRSCYIRQDDLLQPLMTIKELMLFAAKLKLPADTTARQMEHAVSEIIRKMGLTASEDTRTERLSGGQKKRLSVALELINNPPVFFLDEPTSGLDNVSSKQCLTMLRSLAHQGRTIVCTIHQPSALLFELFDNVYVLSQGLCVYQGTTSGLLTFLSSVGLHCPLSYNPADYVIEITDGEEMNNVKVLSTAINNGKIVWKESAEIYDMANIPDRSIDDLKNKDVKMELSTFAMKSDDLATTLGFATTPCKQFSTIMKRMYLQIIRNQTALRIQLVHHVLCAGMIALMFYGAAGDGLAWFTTLKCLIAIIVFHTYTWILVPILSFPNEVKLMQREYFNRWYGFTAYYTALTLSTLPAKIFFSTIFLTMLYMTLGLPFEFQRFTAFSLVGIVVSLIAEGLGYAIGATFSITNGAAVGPACIAPFLGLAVYGFDFANRIPLFTYTLMKLSFMRSGVVALVLTTFGMGREPLDCSDELGYCHFRDPKVLLEMLDVNTTSVWMEMSLLGGLLMFFRILFFFALRRRLKT